MAVVTMKDKVRLYLWEKGQDVKKANKVGNITDVGEIGGEAEEIDTTTIESLAKESENGFEDNGTVELTQNLDKFEYSTMAAYKQNGTDLMFGISAYNKNNEQVVHLTGSCIVKSVKLTGISVGGLLQVKSTLRINGAIGDYFEDPQGATTGIPVSKVTVTAAGESATITTKGGSLQCLAKVEPNNATNNSLLWEVTTASSGATAEITQSGLLTATGGKDGTVTVKATARDGSEVKGELTVTLSNQTGGV